MDNHCHTAIHFTEELHSQPHVLRRKPQYLGTPRCSINSYSTITETIPLLDRAVLYVLSFRTISVQNELVVVDSRTCSCSLEVCECQEVVVII